MLQSRSAAGGMKPHRSSIPPSGDTDTSAGPIYIVGLDRSGKTTMRAFLASHSQIAIPAVGSNMWTYFYGRYGPLDRPDNLQRCLDAMLRYKHVRFLEPDVERIRAEFAAGPQTYARLFSLFLIHYAQKQGKPRWGAQSGLVEQYADAMFDAYPGLRMVHLVRDPRDRYEASLAKWPDGRGRAGGAAARWRFSMRWAERNLGRHPTGYTIVRFEDLISEPEATVRRVCEFLGEPFEPRMMAMASAEEFRRSLGEGTRAEASDLLSTDFIGRYRGRVPNAEVAYIQGHLGKLMQRHGYTPEPLDMPAAERLRFGLIGWPRNSVRSLAWYALELAHHAWPQRLGHTPGRRMWVAIDDEAGDEERDAVADPTEQADRPSVAGS